MVARIVIILFICVSYQDEIVVLPVQSALLRTVKTLVIGGSEVMRAFGLPLVEKRQLRRFCTAPAGTGAEEVSW